MILRNFQSIAVKKILNRSILHIKKSIRLVKKLGSDTYSFHAGFRVDPNVKSLGKQFEKIKMISKQKLLKILLEKL